MIINVMSRAAYLQYIERRNAAGTVTFGPDLELRCPSCGEWIDIDRAQYEGRRLGTTPASLVHG